MKKIALALIAVSGVVYATGVATAGGSYVDAPTVMTTQSSGGPGFAFTAIVEPCMEGESVDFEFQGATGSDICNSSRQASADFTAPALPGEYTGTATLLGYQNDVMIRETAAGGFSGFSRPQAAPLPERPLVLEFDITVADDSTTTVAPTTVAPTTTEAPITTDPAPTTTIDDGSGLPTPTTSPSGDLPATGGSGMNTSAVIALSLFAVGAGMLVVSQVRRRQTTG
jgi:LPXTG-motif cell wall-anchored protein